VVPHQNDQLPTFTTGLYDYEIGLGYGFLGQTVTVEVDGYEILSLIGSDEIEQHAQLLGTRLLASGSSTKQDIMVRVRINGSLAVEQSIDLRAGGMIHIYQESTGLNIYNTPFLVQE
jgi:hypothetical protein